MKYKGYELMKAIAEGKIKSGSRFRDLYQSSKDDFNLYKYENENLKGRFGGTNLIALLNDKFELIEDEIDIDSIEEIKLRPSDREHLSFGGLIIEEKINKLVQAVKQIDKRVKKIEEK